MATRADGIPYSAEELTSCGPRLRYRGGHLREIAFPLGGIGAGLLVTSWPRGNRPAVPTLYSDEVWPGIENQAASHLILEGFVREDLAIVNGARDRHDGLKRDHWDEAECGSHYAHAVRVKAGEAPAVTLSA